MCRALRPHYSSSSNILFQWAQTVLVKVAMTKTALYQCDLSSDNEVLADVCDRLLIDEDSLDSDSLV